MSERDAQLRRGILSAARLNANLYQDGFVPFRVLAGARDREGRPGDGDAHVAALIGELVDRGYLAEGRQVGLQQVTLTPEQRRYKLTDLGWELWMQRAPIDPLVDDQRMEAK